MPGLGISTAGNGNKTVFVRSGDRAQEWPALSAIALCSFLCAIERKHLELLL
ncbi:MAG: hypothetical protein AAFU78_19045 [Cyanobacteria bacterium J06633_2]